MSLTDLFPSIAGDITSSAGVLNAETDFEVLGLALTATDLAETVSGSDNFTLFAPTDAAFASLAVELGFEGDPTDAQAVFDALATALGGLAPDNDPIPLLTDILLYHVSPSEQNLEALEAGGDVTTLLSDSGFELTGGTIIDDDPDAQNGDVIAADLDAGEGVVQVVDRVLLPLDTPAFSDTQTLLDRLKESGGDPDDNLNDFDLLLSALQATGLDTALDNDEAELTLFAPTDQAFLSFAQDLGFEGEDESGALQFILTTSSEADPENPLALVQSILETHVIAAAQDVESLEQIGAIETLSGAEITVGATSVGDQDPDALDPSLVATDDETSNGFLNTIDRILRPSDLPQSEGETPETPDEPDTPSGGDDRGFGGETIAGLANTRIRDEDLPEDGEREGTDDDDDDDGFGFAELAFGLGLLAVLLGGGFVM